MKILLDGIEQGLTKKELIMTSGYSASYIRKVKGDTEKYRSLLCEEQASDKGNKEQKVNMSSWERNFIEEWNSVISLIRSYLKRDIRLVPKQ